MDALPEALLADRNAAALRFAAIKMDTSRRCLAKKQDGSFCLELLDEFVVHAQVCKVKGGAVHRHDSIRDGLVPKLKRYATSVKMEQFNLRARAA